MIRAVLADDERASLQLLREALAATGRVEVVGEAADGVECLRLMEELRPQALFLDIQMDELTGLEVAQIALLDDHPPLIVFITGYEMYAVRAFELSAVDYVVKPADLATFEERIQATVARLVEALAKDEPMPVAAARDVLDRIARENQHLERPNRLPVKDYDQRTVRLLDIAAVVYAEARDGEVRVHTPDKAYATYHTLDNLAQRLERCFPADAATLINLDYVSHLLPNTDGSYDALLQVQPGQLLHTVVLPPPRAKELLSLLGL